MSNVWDRAASYAVCKTLEQSGDGLVNAGSWLVSSGVGAKKGLVSIGLGSLSYLGQGLLCQPQDVGGTPIPDGIGGCYKITEGGYGYIEFRDGRQFPDWTRFAAIDPWIDATEIIKTDMVQSGNRWISRMTFKRLGGGQSTADGIAYDSLSDASRTQWRLVATSGSCAYSPDTPRPLPDGYDTPIQYTDSVTDCILTVTLEGFMRMTEGENDFPVYRIEGEEQPQRASGGRIGACFFEPHLVVGGPDGPNNKPDVPPIPIPPTPPPPGPDGEPWWMPLIRGTVQGATQAVVAKALAELFKTKYPEGTREIYAACDYKENGDPETYSITFPEEAYQDRVLTALNAIVDFQQQILLWKTPTCSTSNKPDLFLHWRSITFESDDYTDSGNRRLVKRLRYRGSSPGDVVELREHWAGFEWDSGGVIVYHKGSPVGTPQVWAASIDEGKRVLRHAFGEAGIDPDQVGEWGTSSSNNSRLGVSRRVKLKTIDGCWMATARPGSSGQPEAAVCSLDP